MFEGRPNLTRLAVAACAAALAVGAGCGGDDEDEETTSTESSTTSTTEETTESAGEKLDDFGFPVNAHVQPQLGAVPEGIELDGREGMPPPSLGRGSLEEAVVTAGCDLELGLPDEGNEHFGDDSTDPGYETNPPTSGDHYAGNETASGALADGAYAQAPPLARAVHALEHGRVQIQYLPDLPEEDQLALKGLFDEDPAGINFFPNPDLDSPVAVAAWTQLMTCESFEGDATLEAIAAFRDEFRGNGPEDIPISL